MATKKKAQPEEPQSPSYSRSSTSADDAVASQVRWEPSVYAGLKAYAGASNSSMNLIANQAVANLLSTDEARDKLARARAAEDEAIRKLSGG